MSEKTVNGWTKEADGVWRHPRYPAGQERQAEGVDLQYNEERNGATLSVHGQDIELSWNELQFLLTQGIRANQQAAAENSRLYKEKEAIMIAEDGYVPPVYVRGRRVS